MRRRTVHPGSRPAVAYLYTLMVSVVLTTIGLGLVHVTRVNARAMSQEGQIAAARALARGAVDDLLQVISSNDGWRSSYTENAWQPERTLGRGTISVKWQSVDGSTARVFGRGTVGDTVRVYSVEVSAKDQPLEILGSAIHSARDVTVSGSMIATGGPVSSNTAVSVAFRSTLDGDAEAPVLLNLGTITGTQTITSPKPMPPTTNFDDLKALATEIPYASIPSGTITKTLLSPSANPYGATSPSGLYYIRIPDGETLTITVARIVANLLVDVEGSAQFKISNEFRLEPADDSRPTLMLRAGSTAQILFEGKDSDLDESADKINFNPPGTPYPYPGGVSDTDISDRYVCEALGLIHTIAPLTVPTRMGNNFAIRGTVIAEGPLEVMSFVEIVHDPDLTLSPPDGYVTGGGWGIVAGTWRWETAN